MNRTGDVGAGRHRFGGQDRIGLGRAVCAANRARHCVRHFPIHRLDIEFEFLSAVAQDFQFSHGYWGWCLSGTKSDGRAQIFHGRPRFHAFLPVNGMGRTFTVLKHPLQLRVGEWARLNSIDVQENGRFLDPDWLRVSPDPHGRSRESWQNLRR